MVGGRCSCSGGSIGNLFLLLVVAVTGSATATGLDLLRIKSILPTHVVRGSEMVLLSIRVGGLASAVDDDGNRNDTCTLADAVAPEQRGQWSCWFGADLDHRVDAHLIADSEVQCWWNVTDGYGNDGDNDIIEVPIAMSADEEEDSIAIILSSTFNLTIVEPIVAVAAFPPLGPTTGSTPVLVEVRDTQERSHTADFPLACLFGEFKVPGSRLNSTHIECHSPAQTRAGRSQLSIRYDDEAALDEEVAAVDRHTWFEYYKQPVLESLSPSACTEMTDTTLSIHGKSFEAWRNYTCRFGSGSAGATVVPAHFLLSAVQPVIQCTTPPLRPGLPIAVEVSANGGFDYTSSGLVLTVYPRFTVLSTRPDEGPIRGGMNLTVLGTNFRTVVGMFCHFGAAVERVGVEAALISPNELSCRIPPSPVLGNVPIEICWGDRLDCVGGGDFSYREELRILSAFPQSGLDVGGTHVWIELDRPFPPGLQCRFGSGIDAMYSPLDSINGTSVGYCVSPAHRETSIVDLTVAGSGYDSALGTVSFVYVTPFSITEIVPRNIPEVDAGIVRVVGANFPNVEGLACLVGSDDSDQTTVFMAIWKSEAEIECNVSDPGLVPGSHPLYIVFGDQSSSSRSTNALDIEVDPAISIAKFAPVAGPPGTMVMVCGTNMASSSTMSCRFGSTVVAADAILNASCVRCLVPVIGDDELDGRGSVSLSVSSNNVHFPKEAPQLSFTYTGEPTIDSLNPDTVDVSRTDVVVEINGTDLHPYAGSEDSFCHLVGTNISTAAVLASDRRAICEFGSMPTEPGAYSLELRSGFQMSFRPARQILVVSSPMVSELEPSWSLTRTRSMGDNSTVLLRGANFTNSTHLSCILKESDAESAVFSAEWISSTSVRCTLPLPLRQGSYTFGVSNDGFVAGSTSVDLWLYDPVQLHSLSPTRGGSDTLITVRGRDFIPGFTCAFIEGGESESQSSVLYAKSQFVNSTCIQCSAPERRNGFGRMEFDVRLDQISMSIGPRIHFDYVDLLIQSIQPPMGSTSGGTIVTINLKQSAFSGTVSHCRFGETVVEAWKASGGEGAVQCSSPPFAKGAGGAATFALSANGIDFVASSMHFYYLSDPIVDGLEPLHGLESGGTPLFLRGHQFANITSLGCRFVPVVETDGRAPHNVAVGGKWSSSEAMYCVTPILYPGEYSVELTTNGQDYIETGFYFRAEPMATISAISPAIARAGGGSIITVEGTNFAPDVLCRFGYDIERAGFFRSSSEIDCVLPRRRVQNSIGAHVNLSISNNGKDFVDAPEPVRIYEDLSMDTFLPLSGSISGGTLVIVRGGNFTNPLAPIRCAFGEYEVEATIDSESLLFCRSPTVSVSANVSLSIVYGSDRYSIPNVSFQYDDHLEVTGLMPTSLPANINTTIAVSGGPFRPSSLLCCRFGDFPTYQATYADSNWVQCRLPKNVRAGSYPLSVANNCLDFTLDPPLVRVLNPVQVLAVSPARGFCDGGSTISVSGSNFADIEIERLSCQMGERYVVLAKERNMTHLLCTVPPSRIPGPVPIQVLVDGVPTDSSPSLTFEYIDLAVTSISPSSGSISGGTAVVVKFRLARSAKAVSHCRFGDLVVEARTGSTGNDDEILCISPSWHGEKGAAVVPMALSLDSVHFSLSQNLYFEYLPDPTIDRVAPSMGPEMGGTEVTLSGSNIVNSIYLGCRFSQVGNDSGRIRWGPVTVNGDWISSNTMSCITPKLFPGEYQVQMIVSDGGHGVDGGHFFVYPQVTIEQIDPGGGPATGGTNITVAGGPFRSSFDLMCKFGDAVAAAIYHNSSKVSCLAPRPTSPARIGPTDIRISANGVDYSNARWFTYYISPIIRELVPSQGVAGKPITVMVRGANFVALSPTAVLCEFGGVVNEGAVLSPDKLRCEAPALPEGEVTVRISLNNGVDWSSPFRDGFVYKELGSIFSLSPSSGPSPGGTTVRVLGGRFIRSSTLCCRVGGTVAQTMWISEKEVHCVTPPQIPGRYAVSVLNDCHNSASESATTVMLFEYYSLPIASSLNPMSGPSCGGTKLQIDGRHFRPDADGLFCMFDDSVRVEATLTSDDRHVECLSPPRPHANLKDAVNVTVGDSSGAFHSEMELLFSYEDDKSDRKDDVDALLSRHGGSNLSHIAVHDIVPNLGMTSGGTQIVVKGNNFDPRRSYEIVFGPNSVVDAEWRSNTDLSCVSPPSPIFGEVEVTIASDGLAVKTNHTFHYLNPLSVSGISPSGGPVEGGTVVNVIGTNFVDVPSLSCRFEESVVPAEFISTNSLRCKAPARVYGPASVDVSVDGSTFYPGRLEGKEKMASITFMYDQLPSIDYVFPSNIPIGQSANVTIYGHNFGSSSGLACRFGDLSVVPAYWLSPRQVSCVIPAVAALGEVDLRVSISTNQADWSLEEISLLLVQDATIAHISPSTVQGGVETALLVEGTGFLDSQNLSCHFGDGGDSFTAATWHSPTTLQCQTPKLDLRFAPGGAIDFSVSNNGGVHLSESKQIQVSARCSVLSVSPSIGYKGQDVVVKSTHHLHEKDDVVCLWADDDKGIPAFFGSSHEIICTAPNHPFDAVKLRIAAHGVAPMDAGTFTLLPDPTIDGLYPVHGPVSGGTNITIVGHHLSNITGCVFEISSRRNESSGDRRLVLPALALSSEEVTCSTPDVTHQTVAMVSLTTSVGGGHTTRGLVFSYRHPPRLLSAEPPIGTTNTSVILAGTGFHDTPELACRFDGLGVREATVVPARFVSSSRVLCQAPSYPIGDAFVAVSTNGRDFGTAAPFRFIAPMAIHSISPRLGSISGGTAVRITGTNIENAGSLSCKFSDTVVAATYLDRNSLLCISPRVSAPTEVEISITANGKDLVMGPPNAHNSRFAYLENPKVVDITPDMGFYEGGQEVKLRTESVYHDPDSTLYCAFGDSLVEVARYNSTLVHCTTPRHQPDGPSSVAVSLVYEHTQLDTTRSTLGGPRFAFIFGAFVASVEPVAGSTLGGTQVELVGVGFLNLHDLICTFGDLRSPARFIDETRVTCETPTTRAVGKVEVKVESSSASLRTRDSLARFEYFFPVSLYSIHPPGGCIGGGTRVQVRGAGFPKAQFHSARCQFGNIDVPGRYVSEQELWCISPSLAQTASRNSTVDFGVSMNGIDWEYGRDEVITFVYVPMLQIERISPPSGPSTGGTIIEIDFSPGDGLRWNNYLCHFGDVVVGAHATSNDTIECTAPRQREEGSIFLEVSRDGGDITEDRRIFTYYQQPVIESLQPPHGYARVGQTVQVFGFGFGLRQINTMSCRFDRRLTSLARWVSSREILCDAPPIDPTVDPRQVSVAIAMNGMDFTPEDNSTVFTYIEEPSVAATDPAVVSADGGTLITLKGKNLENALSCRFGSLGEPSPVLSAAGNAIRCKAPALQPTSPYVGQSTHVYLEFEGLGFYSIGLRVYYEPHLSQDDLYRISLNDSHSIPLVQSIEPNLIGSNGGTSIRVLGDHFVNSGGLACHFDSMVVRARFISSQELQCPTPRIAPGTVMVNVVNGGPEQLMSKKGVQVTVIADASLTWIEPTFGPLRGGTLINIAGTFPPQCEAVVCRFGSIAVHSFTVGGGMVSCISPPLASRKPETVKVQVSCNGGEHFSESFETFSYSSPVQVMALLPSHGGVGGGTRVLVQGDNFQNSSALACTFGSDSVTKATFVSGNQIVCLSPPWDSISPASVHVEVTINGQDYSQSLQKFQYRPAPAIDSIWPNGGPTVGSTEVLITGRNYRDEVQLACSFDGITTEGTYIDNQTLSCHSPPHLPGFVSFRVVGNAYAGDASYQSDPMEFFYYHPPSIAFTTHRRGSALGGTPVIFTGTNLFNSTALRCRFGKNEVRGTFISGRNVLCISPPSNDNSKISTVPVVVSLNGKDFSPQNGVAHEYHRESLPGHYSGPSSIEWNTPAPNGTYAEAGSVNFTLCDPGRFQPKEGQSSCLTCPVGFICPDFGLSKPVLCPAGSLCDRTGLVEPSALCPRGHWCGPGVKAHKYSMLMDRNEDRGILSAVHRLWKKTIITRSRNRPKFSSSYLLDPPLSLYIELS